MIPCAEFLPGAKIRMARAMLLEQHVHPARLHLGNQKITAIIAVGQHHIAFDKRLREPSKQTMLAGALALVGAHGGIEQRAMGQGDHSDDPHQRETHASGLPPVLGEARLIRLGVRHRYRRAIHQFHVPAAPQPPLGRVRAKQRPGLSSQCAHHFLRQALARNTIAARVGTTHHHPAQQAIDQRLIHRVLTRTVGTHDLS